LNKFNSFLELVNISKSYKDVQALDQVSFDIKEGEIFGYIGPNGAGKTTTIKILVGLISEFEGSLMVSGFKMPDKKSEVHKLLGYMPQDVGFQEWRTIDHALSTFGQLSGLDSIKLERRIQEVLKLVGLERERHKKIIHLSGGMTQKLGLAQALLHEPKLLVLDEPLAGLDPESRYQLKNIIKDLSHQGMTCFFSSHILSDVQDVATKIGIINRGKILKIGNLEQLKSHFSVSHNLRIEFSRECSKWQELKKAPYIKDISKESPLRLLIHIENDANADEAGNEIIRRLVNMDCWIKSISPVEPSLDDVYLRFIREGRSE